MSETPLTEADALHRLGLEPDDSIDGPLDAPAKGGRGRKKIPAWRDAIPDDIDALFDDPLALAAKLGPRAVAVALIQVLNSVGMKPKERAKLVGSLSAQLAALVPKERIWEAEKAIRGEAESLKQTTSGPKAEANPLKHAARTQADPTARGAKALRGRPRKRALL